MNSQNAFNHLSFRSRVIFKTEAVLDLPEELRKLQSKRPILLCSTRMAQTALFEKVRGLLAKVHWAQVIDIPAHSSVETVEHIVHLAQAHQADAFICLGGGSVCDSAKAAALVLAEGAPLAQHASRFTPPSTVITPDFVRGKLPIVSIPMTASGAEVTPSLGIRTAQGGKLLFWDAALASRVILIDPQANLEMPAAVMLSTGMNGLAHCIEGLYSHARSPITDTLALSGLCAFDHAMRAVAKDPKDANARGALLVAAHLSGMVLASARSCLHHAICHVLGATFGIGHGDANAVILPHALRFNAPAVQPALNAMAHNLGMSVDVSTAGEKIIQWLNDLQRATQVPTRLRDLGVDPQRLGAVAHHVLHERGLAYNPRAVDSADEIENLLHAAW